MSNPDKPEDGSDLNARLEWIERDARLTEKFRRYFLEALRVDSEPGQATDQKDDSREVKSREDYFREMILIHSGKKIPKDLDAIQRIKFENKILNDPATRHRVIFSQWPRPVEGSSKTYITEENSVLGKMTPNRIQHWGASLFDFYRTQRIPGLFSLSTITTGSKMANWCRENGEADFEPARQLIEWQDQQPDPKVIEPCDIQQLIIDQEAYVHGPTWDKAREAKRGQLEKLTPEDWKLPEKWPPKSLFDPAAYPKPYETREHFSSEFKQWPWLFQTVPRLQQYIPQARLPKKLMVHDPWQLLRASGDRIDKPTKSKPWSEMTDIVHTYKLNLSEKHDARRKEDEEEAAKLQAKEKEIREKFLADPHSRNELPDGIAVARDDGPGPVRPHIFYVLPPKPPLAAADEAHLYLSPAAAIGIGNHSFVYHAEFEVPRSFLVEERLCMECVKEDLEELLSDKDNGINGKKVDPKWEQKIGKVVIKDESKGPLYLSIANREGEGLAGKDCRYLIEEGRHLLSADYEGPLRIFHSRVKYQNLERGQYCKHFRQHDKYIHPLTTMTRVAAKLSIQYDEHLKRESDNYQRFPKHFFEHWSGFNIIRPLHHPVPVGPIVPQFYGYYVPDNDSEAAPAGEEEYLSPILLVEECGKPIKSEELTADDKSECISLILRLHDAGWVHGSVAQRNILVQPGPLSGWPVERGLRPSIRGGLRDEWSFRLIDFGRSMDFEADENGSMRGKQLDAGFHERKQVMDWFNDFEGLSP
ncbi:hypothetical protein NLJ89_g1367 [Agrocybe chaxingu]|uniref:Protein kinase domain-containing protein n=1 Tax=Agrocybe chaxingu TaxID=84603 RepID=A0A9W8TDJ8_9AGAR|nr:hypothetical protein NLJ89_g1367 [Agrocybe chaxingu]